MSPTEITTSKGSSTRKIGTKPASSPQPSHRVSKTSPRPRTVKKTRRVHVPPEPGSLYDLMHRHCGVSLFVRPICWTDLHSELLGVRFSQVHLPEPSPRAQVSFARSAQMTRAESGIAEHALKTILSSPGPYWDSEPVQKVLFSLYPGVFRSERKFPELHLRFGGRLYRDMARVQLLWNHQPHMDGPFQSFVTESTRPADSFGIPAATTPTTPSPTEGRTDLPIMAYVGRPQVTAVRQNLFRVMSGPNSTPNDPVLRLRDLRAKLVQPANLDHDAHMAGIFLAMAQKHFYTTPSPSSQRLSQRSTASHAAEPEPEFRDVRLRILVDDRENCQFIVYTTTVTAEFLRLFHNPRSSLAAGNTGMDIEYAKVPFFPVDRLREQLGRMIGPEVLGTVTTTFEGEEALDAVDATRSESAATLKRRRDRDTLLEAFNRSFDEDTLDARFLGPKRRCVVDDGGTVGTVLKEVGQLGL